MKDATNHADSRGTRLWRAGSLASALVVGFALFAVACSSILPGSGAANGGQPSTPGSGHHRGPGPPPASPSPSPSVCGPTAAELPQSERQRAGVWARQRDRSVDTVSSPASGGIDLRYLRRRRPLGATDPASCGEPRSHAGRTASLHSSSRGVLLPFGEPRGVGDI